MTNSKSTIIGYLISIIGLFFYSFTQVDLNLTLSQWSIWQAIEKFFQHIGYFQRPLSSSIFLLIVLILFALYLSILLGIKRGKIAKKQVWFLIIATALILTFSYNAFSYDLFNYIFDAKIFTYYHQNPYEHKALDYASDPMLSFMHWTHRTYPYGPVWLGLTIPLSFIGLQFFLPTFFLFKALASLSFIGTAFFIGKILRKTSPVNELLGTAFFALNPLAVIESVVSSHNEIVMIFLAMWAVYLLMNKKYIRSFILLVLSIGVKFTSVFILPVFLLIYVLEKRKKKLDWKILFSAMTVLMITPVILASFRTNYQPWYLLYILPFAALADQRYYFFIPSIILSLVSLFQYLPFLYLGNWDEPVPHILFWITVYSIIFSILLSLIWFLKLRFVGRK